VLEIRPAQETLIGEPKIKKQNERKRDRKIESDGGRRK
jgi:hypothetical protein